MVGQIIYFGLSAGGTANQYGVPPKLPFCFLSVLHNRLHGGSFTNLGITRTRTFYNAHSANSLIQHPAIFQFAFRYLLSGFYLKNLIEIVYK